MRISYRLITKGYGLNIVKLVHCDFKSPYKKELKQEGKKKKITKGYLVTASDLTIDVEYELDNVLGYLQEQSDYDRVFN